ncbi:pyridoxamine 5'-phosphate oxidase [Nocardia donostiensis]|uniref:Pyridoxamine 5'-phosphate oxidase n=1 Tax=Nocardia donostiensis TaxID=1538463 RepID=A0A1W0ASG4_9NOCA|nr:pyridoxamine 5'-phosphate oxidase [Nocardia donostiensis]OQS13172.1 pyridoxamine 5'-phosphate oxidase [Nocardia donostiensis]OQS21577.1 pyridoxamine 5'-phosphate oxidase [Nocardia donostiensis]
MCQEYDGYARRTVELARDEALGLLASVPFGRIVFTSNALPAIRPVNHLVDSEGFVVVRTRLLSGLAALMRPGRSVVVAYEADEIDPVRRIGWSVVVTGLARTVTTPERVAEYGRTLQPWVEPRTAAVITIEPTIVSGLRLVA